MSFAKPASADSIANAIPHRSVKRYTCMANQCPMPGTISGEGGNGVCAYHYNTHGPDWPRITQTLLDWAILTEEINHCRKVLTDPATAAKPAIIADEFRIAWQRIKDNLGPWTDAVKPQLTRGGHTDSYGSWALRLEQFMGQRVVECLSKRVGRQAA
jgi:hypothetical protein